MPAADKATRFVKLLTATAAEVLETITSEEKAALELQLSTLTAEEVCVCAQACVYCAYVRTCMHTVELLYNQPYWDPPGCPL